MPRPARGTVARNARFFLRMLSSEIIITCSEFICEMELWNLASV